MPGLFLLVQSLVRSDRYVVGLDASERLEERGLMEWQAVAGLEDGEFLRENLDAVPNPTVEVRQLLPDGTPYKAV